MSNITIEYRAVAQPIERVSIVDAPTGKAFIVQPSKGDFARTSMTFYFKGFRDSAVHIDAADIPEFLNAVRVLAEQVKHR